MLRRVGSRVKALRANSVDVSSEQLDAVLTEIGPLEDVAGSADQPPQSDSP